MIRFVSVFFFLIVMGLGLNPSCFSRLEMVDDIPQGAHVPFHPLLLVAEQDRMDDVIPFVARQPLRYGLSLEDKIDLAFGRLRILFSLLLAVRAFFYVCVRLYHYV